MGATPGVQSLAGPAIYPDTEMTNRETTEDRTEVSKRNSSTPPAPYVYVPRAVPGRIRAEDFDVGGEGEVYHAERGTVAARANCVDIQRPAAGGRDVGWIENDEWWEYAIEVESSGAYDVSARVASASGGGTVRAAVDGRPVGAASFGPTGGWRSWTTERLGSIDLSAGEHAVRVTTDAGGWNLDWIEFERGDDDAAIAEIDPSATAAAVGERITFEAEDATGPDCWVDSLEWSFGDGTTATGWWNVHSYDSPGRYTVTLTATAVTGATATREVTIDVS